MKIGIIGSGVVGTSLGSGFISSGNSVKIGTRHPKKLDSWKNNAGVNASVGSFEETADFGDVIVLATKWDGTKNALNLSKKKNFEGKIVVDVTNPLDFSKGEVPQIAVTPEKSGGATVQNWLPKSKVVKAFNIVNANTMCNPKMLGGTPDLLIAGNDKSAKKWVSEVAKNWGWENIIDLGDINESYWLEALVLLWVRYGRIKNSRSHAFKVLEK